MTTKRIIVIGITIIIISSVFLWLSSLIHSYVYNRMHINRNGLLTCLWLLNSFSSYLLYFYNIRGKLLISLLYILFWGGLMTLMHFIFWNETYGDFSGIEGLKVISGVYFAISTITICIGVGVGFITSCLKRK